jgi:4-hydroxybenzoate polyprenyltransferase
MSSATLPANPLERARTYASFVRFEHTLFSLPLIVAGIFSAAGPALSASRWLLIALAAAGARTTAMAMNRLIDRRIDALNPRTRARELPAGRMKEAEAWGLLLVSGIVYLLCCGALGEWYLKVSGVPLLVFVVYPYLKRVTPFCHFGVGSALALAPLAGYAAGHPDLASPQVALWLGSFALLWVSGFDVIYATLDEEFDRAHGLRSMVAWLGRDRALRVSAVLHLLAFACLAGAMLAILGAAELPAPWGWPAAGSMLAVAGTLLFLEQRWVGFAVLALVLVARAAGGF